MAGRPAGVAPAAGGGGGLTAPSVVALLGATAVTRPHRGYAAALPVLAARGLVPGPGGFAAGDLVAYGQRRGWTVSVEPAPARRGRWRARILARRAGPGGYRGVINVALPQT